MNKLKFIIVCLIVLSVVLPACSGPAQPVQTPTRGPVDNTPVVATKPAWQADWETTLAAARKEGEVTVYTTYGAEWRTAMSEAMSKKYGITFNVLTGRSDELMERIGREQQNKLYQADSIQAISGKRYFVEAQQLKEIFPSLEKTLVLPEVLDTKAWVDNKFPWVDTDTKNLVFWRDYLSVPIIINTDMVNPQEMASWDSLLDPKWKGKMVLSDPTIAGAANSVITVLLWGIKDWGYLDRLLKQEPVIQRDYRLMSEWVARGKYAIMIGPRKEEAQVFIDAGAPIKYMNFSDGVITTFGAGTIANLKGSPHPNAAKVFVNFLLTQEGQTLTAKVGGFPSARLDVPTDFLDAATLRRPGMKAFSTDSSDYLQKVDDINKRLKQTVEPFLK